MKESDIVKVLLPEINKSLADAGLNVIVLKGYQTTGQGIPFDAAVFYHMIRQSTSSTQKSILTYNDVADNFTTSNNLQAQINMQLTCRVITDPANDDPVYASDILTEIRNRLSPVEVNRRMKKLGVGIYVPPGITTSVQQNEHDQWEPMPILELGLSYVSGYNVVTERVKSIESEIKPI